MKFPILIIDKKQNLIFVFRKYDMFTRTNSKLLYSGAYNGGIVIDINQDSRELLGAEKIGWATPFWGINPFVVGRVIRVKPKVKYKGRVSMHDIKQMIIDSIEFDEYWSESYINFEDFIVSVNKCKSIIELIDLFY